MRRPGVTGAILLAALAAAILLTPPSSEADSPARTVWRFSPASLDVGTVAPGGKLPCSNIFIDPSADEGDLYHPAD